MIAGETRERVLWLEQPAEAARQGEQDRIPDRDADGIVDLLEAVEIDHHHGRADRRIALGKRERGFQPVEEQFAIGEPRQVVVHCVVEQPLLGVLHVGHVGERADHAHDLAVRSHHRPGLEREPQIMAVVGAQAQVEGEPPAPLVDDAVERRAEAVAVVGMEHVEPARGGAFQRSPLEAEQMLGLGTGEDLVGVDVPVPDQVAGAGEREGAPLDVGNDRRGDAAGEGVLHDGEADQHHDQYKAAEQRRRDDVVGHDAGDGEARGKHPGHQQQPSRDQEHRAIESVGREVDDEPESGDRDQRERHAGDAGGDRRVKQSEPDQGAKKDEPAGRDMGVAHVPAVEVEVGEQEHQQGRGQDRLARGAPHALGVDRQVEHLAPEAEVGADVGKHRPAQGGRCREHHAALHHEQDGEEERQQAGDTDDDAEIEREAVDLVLVGLRFPQIELRQLFRARFRHERDHRAGIERDAEYVGGGAVLAFGRVTGRRREIDEARRAEVRPQQPGADHAVARRHQQPVDLVGAVIGEREHHPMRAWLARAHLDAADDAFGVGGGGHLDAVAFAFRTLERVGEVDRRRVDADVDGVDGAHGRGNERRDDNRGPDYGAPMTQTTPPN